MKFVLAVCLITCCKVACAANWVHISSTSTSAIGVEPSSIVPSGNKWKAWLLWNYDQESSLKSNPSIKYWSMKELNYFDCKERTFVIAQQVLYSEKSGEGQSVHSVVIDPKNFRYEDVVPGSAGETILETVCKMARARSTSAPRKSNSK